MPLVTNSKTMLRANLLTLYEVLSSLCFAVSGLVGSPLLPKYCSFCKCLSSLIWDLFRFISLICESERFTKEGIHLLMMWYESLSAKVSMNDWEVSDIRTQPSWWICFSGHSLLDDSFHFFNQSRFSLFVESSSHSWVKSNSSNTALSFVIFISASILSSDGILGLTLENSDLTISLHRISIGRGLWFGCGWKFTPRFSALFRAFFRSCSRSNFSTWLKMLIANIGALLSDFLVLCSSTFSFNRSFSNSTWIFLDSSSHLLVAVSFSSSFPSITWSIRGEPFPAAAISILSCNQNLNPSCSDSIFTSGLFSLLSSLRLILGLYFWGFIMVWLYPL